MLIKQKGTRIVNYTREDGEKFLPTVSRFNISDIANSSTCHNTCWEPIWSTSFTLTFTVCYLHYWQWTWQKRNFHQSDIYRWNNFSKKVVVVWRQVREIVSFVLLFKAQRLSKLWLNVWGTLALYFCFRMQSYDTW